VPSQLPSVLPVRKAALLFRLLGEPSRLRLLVFLAERGEASVGDLAAAAGLSQPCTSNHLMLLSRGRVVDRRREGHKTFYRICSSLAAELLERVDGVDSPSATARK
jgi:DNA-binding transcriptional ArsR family regulator